MVLANSAKLSVRLSNTRCVPLNLKTRQLSLQYARALPKVPPYALSTTRNYWWSKSKAPLLESATTTSPEHLPAPVPEVSPSPTTTSDSISATTTTTPEYLPVPKASSSPATESVTDISSVSPTSDIIPPLNYGDFAELGIAGWSPAGIIRWSFELLQVSTGMPWFYTIVAGTVLWRAVLAPVSLSSIRNSARLLPYSKQLLAIGEETKSVPKGDRLAMQRILLKRQKLYEQAGVKVGPSMFMPFIQIPVTLGMFLGVKTMVQLPVEQLKQSGFTLLPDLTVADPYFILPIITTAMVNLQMMVMRKDMNIADRPEMAHFMNFMRVMSIAGIPFMGHLPCGLWVSVATGVAATTLQSIILQRPAVREALKIPPLVKQAVPFPTMLQTVYFVRLWWQNKKNAANTQALKGRR